MLPCLGEQKKPCYKVLLCLKNQTKDKNVKESRLFRVFSKTEIEAAREFISFEQKAF